MKNLNETWGIAFWIAFLSTFLGVCSAMAQGPGTMAAADRMRQMFEEMGKSTGDFMPGFFTNLSDEQIKKLEAIPISSAEENEFGKQVLADFESRMKQAGTELTKVGNDVAYLTQLVAKIQPRMKNAKRYTKFEITVVKSDELAAYSIPGARLIFSTGMLDNMPSEAALVGVVAHELSHLDHGHQLLALKQSKQMGKGMNMKDGMLWISTIAKPMRPEFESIADADAIRWTIQAGYDPRALAKVLEQWDQKQNRETPWADMIPGFAKSHPDSGVRAQAMYRLIDRSRVDFSKLKLGSDEIAKRRNPQ
jgi:predicted Zn-dependent protease